MGRPVTAVTWARFLSCRCRQPGDAAKKVSTISFKAIAHIVTAMSASRTRQDVGLVKIGRKYFAPWPSEKKKRNEPVIAPAANEVAWPGKRVEMAPSRMTVSR